MMLTPLKNEVLKVDDLSHEARRFRTIVWSFRRNLELLFRDTGLTASVDHAALADAFARWRQKFDQSKHLADVRNELARLNLLVRPQPRRVGDAVRAAGDSRRSRHLPAR